MGGSRVPKELGGPEVLQHDGAAFVADHLLHEHLVEGLDGQRRLLLHHLAVSQGTVIVYSPCV